MTNKFGSPNKHQHELLVRNKIDPDGVCILGETERYLHVRNYKTQDEITLEKGYRTQRIEREAGLTWS